MMVGMDDTIKLDRRSFEALAAESRVKTLKALSKRRKTLTELSNELGLSVSTMKEHLDVLVKAGLIIQRDEGRKWKYYELTRKGKGIVNPYPAKVLIVLAVSLLLVFGGGWNFVNSFGAAPLQEEAGAEVFMLGGAAAPEEEAAPMASYAAADGEMLEAEPLAEAEDAEAAPKEMGPSGEDGAWAPEMLEAHPSLGPQEVEARQEFPLLWAGVIGLGALLFLVSVYYLVK